jgi:hypothetical protein
MASKMAKYVHYAFYEKTCAFAFDGQFYDAKHCLTETITTIRRRRSSGEHKNDNKSCSQN